MPACSDEDDAKDDAGADDKGKDIDDDSHEDDRDERWTITATLIIPSDLDLSNSNKIFIICITSTPTKWY